MAIFEVELPTGQILEIEAPDDTPEEVIRQRAQRYRMERAGLADDPAATGVSQSKGENFAAGMGKAAVDMFRGGQQLMVGNAPASMFARGLIGGPGFMATGADPRRATELQAQVDEAARLDAPLMDTGAGLAGNIAGNIAVSAVPGGAAVRGGQALGTAGRLAAGAATGGGLGALQPTATGESRALNIGLGAALGGVGEGVSMGVGRALKGASDKLKPAARELYEKARAAGIPVSAADLTNSRFLRWATSVADNLPFSGAAARAERGKEAFSTAVARTVGENEPLTPEVYSRALDKAGAQFGEIAKRNTMQIDDALRAEVNRIHSEATKVAAPDVASAVKAYASEVLTKAGGMKRGKLGTQLPGEAYQSIRSRLGKQANTVGGEKGLYLGQVQDALDSAMDRSILRAGKPDDVRAWQDVRGVWRRLRQLRPLVAREAGQELSPAALMQRVVSGPAGEAAMATGRGGDLGDLARIGQRFMKEPPSSGTSERMLVQSLLGLGGGYALGGPETAGGAALGGLLAPRALRSRALARYAAQGAPQLLQRGGGALLPYLPASTAGLLPIFPTGDAVEQDPFQQSFR